ncbi:TfuA-like protein [Lichenifustis flavocetrariae]|uniref:TfuA-like protein n=1 Tax=Lichenifustis flavocetrariae TaxID=2949735 RepID=A0AA41YT08_9HYPH|nr:TfuA-like protein [Lichenifustis flavocetrariae]MCW6506780.1 TfuA-like protein [Lichenifustis flavocetrariae]
MTAACVFVGPTLPASEVARHLDAVCLPPVAQGDVIGAVRRYRPQAIGLIDGVFGGAPAVWHKEILWALSEGVAVFGSASMGALRAAELHGFGMRGVGRIFEAYRDGALEDDDDVAVIYGPAEIGYPCLSEPMVNIRETLSQAQSEGILAPSSRLAIERFAKSLHFPERTWSNILNGETRPDRADLSRIQAWVETGRVDLKRRDALAMLTAMRDTSPQGATTSPSFHFERTTFWADLTARIATVDAASDDQNAEAIVDELRLEMPDLFRDLRDESLLRYAIDLVQEPTGAEDRGLNSVEAADDLRASLHLYNQAAFQTWLARNDVTPHAFDDLAARLARQDRFRASAIPVLSRYLLDELRFRGDYERFAARAQRKQAHLAEHLPSEELAPSMRLALRDWFCRHRLGQPGDLDLGTILERSGFADAAHLDRALRLEHLYLTLSTPAIDG